MQEDMHENSCWMDRAVTGRCLALGKESVITAAILINLMLPEGQSHYTQ